MSGEQSHDGLRVTLIRRRTNMRATGWSMWEEIAPGCDAESLRRNDGYEVVEMMPVAEASREVHSTRADRHFDRADATKAAAELEAELASEREKLARVESARGRIDDHLTRSDTPDAVKAVLRELRDALPSLDAGESERHDGQSREARQETISKARDTVESGGLRVGPAVQVDDDRPERLRWRIAAALHGHHGEGDPWTTGEREHYLEMADQIIGAPSLPADRGALIERVERAFEKRWGRFGMVANRRAIATEVVDALAGVVPDGRELERLRATKKLHDQAHDRLDELGVSRTSQVDVPSVRELPERIDLLAARAGGRGLSAEPSEDDEPVEMAAMREILADPEAAMRALPEAEQQRYREAQASIVQARQSAAAHGDDVVLGGRVDAVSSTETDERRVERGAAALCRFVFPGFAVPREAMAQAVLDAADDPYTDWLDRLPTKQVLKPCESRDAGLLAVLADPSPAVLSVMASAITGRRLSPRREQLRAIAVALHGYLSSYRGTESDRTAYGK